MGLIAITRLNAETYFGVDGGNGGREIVAPQNATVLVSQDAADTLLSEHPNDWTVSDSKVGDLSLLDTTEKGSCVAAINEVYSLTTAAEESAAIGDLDELDTEEQGTLVGAINEVNGIAEAAYVKPAEGIPSTDMAAAVGASLGLADSAYQLPAEGIPSSDMETAVQTSLGLADSAYQLPENGIATDDLADGVTASLGLADSAYQKPAGGVPVADLAALSGTLTVSNAGGTGTLILTGFAVNYLVQATLLSGPAGCFLRFTKGEASCAVAVVDATGNAVDCSSTNAVIDWIAYNLPEA